jgi:hypothetical protein
MDWTAILSFAFAGYGLLIKPKVHIATAAEHGPAAVFTCG